MVVLAPHADDEVLGAGGLMARAHAHGWEVHVSFATISGYASVPRAECSSTLVRCEEVRNVMRMLGCASYRTLFVGEEQHLRLDTVPQADIVDFIDSGVREVRPSIVVAPAAGHYHQDHRALAEATVAALRPAPDGVRPLVPIVLTYGHAHGGWGGERYVFRPALFVDISEFINAKLEALACYASQVCREPHPRSVGAVREQCAAWGAYAGVKYAEAFECLRFLA